MKQDSISESLLFNGLYIAAILVLALFCTVSAIGFEDPDTDTGRLPFNQLDSFALARFRDDNASSYSLVFWGRYAITVIKAPSSALSPEGSSAFTERIIQQLSIKPLNTADSVDEAGVLFSRYDIWNSEYAIVVCELNTIYEGLTPVQMPFENGIIEFDQWFNAPSSHSSLSAVVDSDHSQKLFMVPLTFDPDSYREQPGWITAEHDGSTFQATEMLNDRVLSGMSCLGQNHDGPPELMFLGIKPDQQIYQYNKPDGDPVAQIAQVPFLPLERIIHLIATTAGIRQGQPNRWHYSLDGTVTQFSLSSNDVLSQFGQPPDTENNGYLCQSKCTIGTAPADERYCRTGKGKYQSFYVLEGRLVEWVLVKNGDLPDHVRYADAESDCTRAQPMCFVASAQTAGFGEVDEYNRCNIGDGSDSYFDYRVPVIISDEDATADSEEPASPALTHLNTTEDFSGKPHVVVITDSGFSAPPQLTFRNNSNDPDHGLPGPETTKSNNEQIIVIAIAMPAAIITSVIVAGLTFYCYCRKPANTSNRDAERTRLFEEHDSSPPSSPPVSGDVRYIPLRTLSGGSGASPGLLLRTDSSDTQKTLDRFEPRPKTIEVYADVEPVETEESSPPEEGVILIPPEERLIDNRPNRSKSKIPDGDSPAEYTDDSDSTSREL